MPSNCLKVLACHLDENKEKKMARKAMIEKALRTPKFAVRQRNRCSQCGRPRGFIRLFELCRLCFRNYALKGVLPGVKKTSW